MTIKVTEELLIILGMTFSEFCLYEINRGNDIIWGPDIE